MNTRIDLNCDMGEGAGNEESLMPFISSANIACGYHAGDEGEMKRVVELCLQHGVAIGAHPSFADRQNFGRKEMNLSQAELIDLVSEQLSILDNIVRQSGSRLHHVKPHGALYNMAAKDDALAGGLVKAIKTFNPMLILYGLAGSVMICKSRELGLKFAEEAFADRRYMPDGSLVPRPDPAALINDPAEAVQQVLGIALEQQLFAVTGEKLLIKAGTICIHGDGPQAVPFAKAISLALPQSGIVIGRPT
jgi:UPF0271 protein